MLSTVGVNPGYPRLWAGTKGSPVVGDGDGGVVYEARITTTNGTRATVRIDAGFTITATETGGHDGHWFTVVLRAG